jgi:plasmid maintenance system antidote protein VapI
MTQKTNQYIATVKVLGEEKTVLAKTIKELVQLLGISVKTVVRILHKKERCRLAKTISIRKLDQDPICS